MLESSGKKLGLIVSIVIFTSIFAGYAFAASVATDKTDYTPNSTVIITGTGFLPSTSINLTIVNPDSSIFSANPTTDVSGTFVYNYTLDDLNGIYYVYASDGTNSASTSFTDPAPVFIISITQPTNNSIVSNPVRVFGKWNVTNPPGQTSDFNVLIQWGDGNTTNAVNINRSASTNSSNPPFISGTYDTETITGCTSADNATDNCSLGNFDHTYSTCGNFTITAKLYHAQPTGAEDNHAVTIMNVSGCVTPVTSLMISKSFNTSSAAPGTGVLVTLNITNNGSTSLNPVKVVDVLPSGLAYADSASPVQSSNTTQTVIWNNVGPLSSGTSAIITFVAKVLSNDTAGIVTNFANATGTPSVGNNTSANTTANLTIASVCGDNFVTFGEQCELPNILNNPYCSESTSSCSVDTNQTGTRNLFGNCDSTCQCSSNQFSYSCVNTSCGATCNFGDAQTINTTCITDQNCSGTWLQQRTCQTSGCQFGQYVNITTCQDVPNDRCPVIAAPTLTGPWPGFLVVSLIGITAWSLGFKSLPTNFANELSGFKWNQKVKSTLKKIM